MVLLKVLFFRARTFFRVKTLGLQSGDDAACAPFPSCWRCFWTFGAVLVMLLLLFQEIDHVAGLLIYIFCNSSFSFWLCASVMPLGQYFVAEAGYN
jgi:hypothetical protein